MLDTTCMYSLVSIASWYVMYALVDRRSHHILHSGTWYPCSASFHAEWCAIAYATTTGLLGVGVGVAVVGGVLAVVGHLYYLCTHIMLLVEDSR